MQHFLKELEFELKIGGITDVVKLHDVVYINMPEYDQQESYEDLVFQAIEINGEEIDDYDWEELNNPYVDLLYKRGIETFLSKIYKD